jgi:hypothetical protein
MVLRLAEAAPYRAARGRSFPGGGDLRKGSQQRERILAMADAFLAEARRDLERAASLGCDLPPRLRSVHSRPGHATPEYRTRAIPPDPAGNPLSPDTLSEMIARYTALKPPSCAMLAMDGISTVGGGDERPVLIAEVRDAESTRAFWMQTYRTVGGSVKWDDPVAGGWQDPADNELILDLAFARDMEAPPQREAFRAAEVPPLPPPNPAG